MNHEKPELNGPKIVLYAAHGDRIEHIPWIELNVTARVTERIVAYSSVGVMLGLTSDAVRIRFSVPGTHYLVLGYCEGIGPVADTLKLKVRMVWAPDGFDFKEVLPQGSGVWLPLESDQPDWLPRAETEVSE